MVQLSIILYIVLSILIGLWASKRVSTSSDFINAGRALPFHLSLAALFATWFGSETVLGASAEMAKHGLYGVIEDPFGAALCLILLGFVFAKPLYKLNLNTFGDFYRDKYNPTTELIASIMLVITYFGWIAGQFVALGVLFNSLFDIPIAVGIIIGAIIVVFYTSWGGMWTVATLDFIQMLVIIVGLGCVLFFLNQLTPLSTIIDDTPKEHFTFFKYNSPWQLLNYFAMWITIGLGSIPQQDVFQRVMSSKSAKQAQWASVGAGVLYLTIAIIPLLIALYANGMNIQADDEQLFLPQLILKFTPSWVQVMFFGALLSAIMSTAGGALLAPASIISQNLFNHFMPHKKDISLLWVTRLSIGIVAILSLFFSFTNSSIYELVAGSNALSLVSLFIPLVFGLFSKRKIYPTSALISIFSGLIAWITANIIETEVNPILYGLLASLLGMIISQLIVSYSHENTIRKAN